MQTLPESTFKSLPQTRRMHRQPSWPNGNEPDAITEIQGGFTDGTGESFPVPVGAFAQVDAIKTPSGVWVWMIYPKVKGE